MTPHPASRDWGPFALLLIDAQEDFWGATTAELFPAFAERVAGLLELCRREGLDVIHLRAEFRPDGSDWMPVYRLGRKMPCVRGTAGVGPLPCAREQENETVITKQSYDGFCAPELLRHLRASGKRFLLTAGLVTSVCVLLTTASAAQRGFLTAIVEDCCADWRTSRHEQTLDTDQSMLFGRVELARITDNHAAWEEDLRRLAESTTDDQHS